MEAIIAKHAMEIKVNVQFASLNLFILLRI